MVAHSEIWMYGEGKGNAQGNNSVGHARPTFKSVNLLLEFGYGSLSFSGPVLSLWKATHTLNISGTPQNITKATS